MAIPAFNEHGLLPDGIHKCSPEESGSDWGRFRAAMGGPHWTKFKDFMKDTTACRLVEAVLVADTLLGMQLGMQFNDPRSS